MRILVVEDDESVAGTLEDLLSPQYAVDVARTGKDGLYKAEVTDYDLIVLDLGLPDMTGHAVCQALRERKVASPIIILTGRDDLQHKVSALDGGADDYVTKPFKFPELAARIRAVLRRGPGAPASNVLEHGGLRLDTVSRTVSRNGQPVTLRRKEFDLLEYLLRNQGRVVSRAMILDHVWDDGGNQFSNIVDVHVKYLRDRVERPFNAPLIKTVHGIGYTISS